IIQREIQAGQARRRPRYERFSLVAGVPFGGLLLAIAYALQTDTSLVYPHPGGSGDKVHTVEGRFVEGDHVLILDDLMTGGTSILRTAELLEEHNLEVSDAIVLIDREEGAVERLRQRGYHVTSLLTLRQMLTYYHETSLIASILRAAGRRVVHNRSGANPVSGVASALVGSAHPAGRVRGDIGLFEVDEASVAAVVEALRPRVLAVNNLFRDQLDRYGEV